MRAVRERERERRERARRCIEAEQDLVTVAVAADGEARVGPAALPGQARRGEILRRDARGEPDAVAPLRIEDRVGTVARCEVVDVVALATVETIATRAADQRVVASAAFDVVLAGPAVQQVAAVVAAQIVVPVTAIEHIVATVADERVLAAEATNAVDDGAAHQCRRRPAAEAVVRVGAVDVEALREDRGVVHDSAVDEAQFREAAEIGRMHRVETIDMDDVAIARRCIDVGRSVVDGEAADPELDVLALHAVTEHENAGVGTAGVPGGVVDDVLTVALLEEVDVTTGTADEDIGTGAAGEHVVAGATFEPVFTEATVEVVGATARRACVIAEQDITARPTEQHVGPRSADEDIVTGAAVEEIVGAVPVDPVVASAGVDRVAAGGREIAHHHVVEHHLESLVLALENADTLDAPGGVRPGKRAGIALDVVVTATPDDEIVATAAGQPVVTCRADDPVVARTAENAVALQTRPGRDITLADRIDDGDADIAVEHVVADAAVDHVATGCPAQDAVGTAFDEVGLAAREDGVPPRPAEQPVAIELRALLEDELVFREGHRHAVPHDESVGVRMIEREVVTDDLVVALATVESIPGIAGQRRNGRDTGVLGDHAPDHEVVEARRIGVTGGHEDDLRHRALAREPDAEIAVAEVLQLEGPAGLLLHRDDEIAVALLVIEAAVGAGPSRLGQFHVSIERDGGPGGPAAVRVAQHAPPIGVEDRVVAVGGDEPEDRALARAVAVDVETFAALEAIVAFLAAQEVGAPPAVEPVVVVGALQGIGAVTAEHDGFARSGMQLLSAVRPRRQFALQDAQHVAGRDVAQLPVEFVGPVLDHDDIGEIGLRLRREEEAAVLQPVGREIPAPRLGIVQIELARRVVAGVIEAEHDERIAAQHCVSPRRRVFVGGGRARLDLRRRHSTEELDVVALLAGRGAGGLVDASEVLVERVALHDVREVPATMAGVHRVELDAQQVAERTHDVLERIELRETLRPDAAFGPGVRRRRQQRADPVEIVGRSCTVLAIELREHPDHGERIAHQRDAVRGPEVTFDTEELLELRQQPGKALGGRLVLDEHGSRRRVDAEVRDDLAVVRVGMAVPRRDLRGGNRIDVGAASDRQGADEPELALRRPCGPAFPDVGIDRHRIELRRRLHGIFPPLHLLAVVAQRGAFRRIAKHLTVVVEHGLQTRRAAERSAARRIEDDCPGDGLRMHLGEQLREVPAERIAGDVQRPRQQVRTGLQPLVEAIECVELREGDAVVQQFQIGAVHVAHAIPAALNIQRFGAADRERDAVEPWRRRIDVARERDGEPGVREDLLTGEFAVGVFADGDVAAAAGVVGPLVEDLEARPKLS